MNTVRVVVAGLVASIVMGMVQMLYEAVAGAGLWSPVVYITATIFRDLQSVARPVPFLFLPVFLGLMGHMMNSVILGAAFAALVGRRVQGPVPLAVAGMVSGLVVFLAMWLAVLPVIDPVMLRLNGVIFALAHLMWGGTLGLVLGWDLRTEGRPILRPAH